jgi:transcriptional regulator with XRE-family HTH domain
MEMNLGADVDYVPSGGDLAISQRTFQDAPSGTCSVVVVPARSLLASVVFGTSIFLTPPAMAAALPHFGTSPSVEDLRPAVTVAAVPRSTDQGSIYRQILVQSFGHQAKEAMTALSLTKSQLAGVLRVSRPTVYAWLGGKEPSPGNADRLTAVLRLLARAGMSSEAPLNARFVRHAIHERSSSLIELLCAEELDEAKIEDMLREAGALGEEAESRRVSREDRLRSLGYQEQSPEQRREQLNQTVAMLDWPKR